MKILKEILKKILEKKLNKRAPALQGFLIYNFLMKKSFTIIELLIVLAIIAGLMAILINYLKPVEIFKKTRDTRRIADLNSLDYIINSLIYEDPSINLGATNTVYLSLPMDIATTNCKAQYTQLPDLPSGWSYYCVPRASTTNIDGTGWIPINFSNYKVVNIQKLPIDPLNTPPYYYTYVAGGSYVLYTQLERLPNDMAKNDGDNYPYLYSVGTDKSLIDKAQGLVLYLPFDEGNGTMTKDYSGNENNSTITGASWAEGKIGQALSFDGVDDYVEIPHSESLAITKAISIEAWFNTATKTLPNNHRMIFSFRSGTYLSLYSNGYAYPLFSLYIDGTSRAVNSNFSPSIGKWHHVVGTWDGVTMSIYVDGVLRNSASPRTGTLDTGTTSKFVGKYTISGYEFYGLIDEVRVYNRALSADEVRALYDATK